MSAGQRPEQADELVTTRMERQEILNRDDPPWLVVLLDESVIHRVVGDDRILRGQLQRLLEAVREPNVTLRIVPFGARIYPLSAFNILAFHDAPTIGYVDGVGKRGQLIEDRRQVRDTEVLFDRIGALALPAPDPEKLIQKALEDL